MWRCISYATAICCRTDQRVHLAIPYANERNIPEGFFKQLLDRDAVRKAVSLGADADTLGAIVGSIAEAIWGSVAKMGCGRMKSGHI